MIMTQLNRKLPGFLADSVVTGIAMDLSLIKEKVKLDKKVNIQYELIVCLLGLLLYQS